MQKHNFYAGPSILPQEVFKGAAEAVLNFKGTGLSILEVSHRSKEFSEVVEETIALTREILGLGDSWEVLFLQGGASSQFFMTAMNLLGESDKAYYVNTGTWSKKAIAEAQKLGNIEVLASSADEGFTYIPKGYDVPADARYLHITTNNTIFGTQYQALPEAGCPLVADMSSDFLSRPVDINKFGLIYAGAQKNLGPAGLTMVLVNKDFLGSTSDDLPTMLNYQTHINKGSMFNTPPAFAIYVAMLNLRWLKANGGLEGAARRNARKAEVMYGAIDSSPLFKGVVVSEDRSAMNATFVLEDDSNSDAFMAMCAEADIIGIKGHRSVGGFRASMYNAMGVASVEVLADVMSAFTQKYG